MFEVINEFAVLGTASFMMALATVWYSPMLFGNMWMRATGITEEVIEKTKPDMWKHMLLTFLSYVVMLGLLSQVIAYAPKLALEPLAAAALLTLFVAAAAIPTTLFEGKSVWYYGMQVGFYVVFILLGTLILQYWPW